MSDELPEGWARAGLSEVVADLQNGPFGSALHRADYIAGGVPLINPANIVGGRLVPDPEITVGPAVTARLAGSVMRPGDVVVGRRGEMGRAAVVTAEREAWFCGTGSAVVRPGLALDSRFLAMWFGSPAVRSRLETEAVGATMKNLSTRILGGLEMGLPPLAEQRRIVAKVEALLAEVNAARDRLAKVPAILKRFRQSVLAAACSGRLTKDRREAQADLEAARELVSRVAAARSILRLKPARPPRDDLDTEVPETWAVASCDQLTRLVTSGSRGWAAFYSATGAIFIRAQDINTDELVLDEVAHVTPPAGAEGERTKVQRDDVLITITGANVAKAALVNQALRNAYVSQHIALVRPVLSEIASWLHLWTVGPAQGRAQLLDAAYGAGKPGLSLDNVREMVVALPPADEQHVIRCRVAALLKLAGGVEQRVAVASARAEKLTQTILAKAFRGELVPAEAELARQEGRDYEPASVMLERIKAERTVAPRSPHGRGHPKAAAAPKRARPRRRRSARGLTP